MFCFLKNTFHIYFTSTSQAQDGTRDPRDLSRTCHRRGDQRGDLQWDTPDTIAVWRYDESYCGAPDGRRHYVGIPW